jgi:hypothetical protein
MSAATPPRVTGDFVATVLQIKGGTGAAIPAYLKRIGLVASDGAPTDLYVRFRLPATRGAAIADAIRIGYKELLKANEYFYKLNDKDLLALIIQVTGVESDSRAAMLTLSTLKSLKNYADFEAAVIRAEPQARDQTENFLPPTIPAQSNAPSSGIGLNLAYTINLNLPATSDQAVFNAIFRSLREHLISSNE